MTTQQPSYQPSAHPITQQAYPTHTWPINLTIQQAQDTYFPTDPNREPSCSSSQSMHISGLKATAAVEDGDGGGRRRREDEGGERTPGSERRAATKEVDTEDRTATVAVEETGRTEARKGEGRCREQRLSWVAGEERVEEVEDETGGELRRRRNRERRKWRRARRNGEMGDGFPSPATERRRGSSRGGERDRRSRNEKRQGGRRSTATWSLQRMRRRKRGEEI